jgi:F0F1-type ATP synthase assembly protein I
MARPSNAGPTGGDLAGIGMYFAAAVLLPLLAGVGLDSWLHTGPVFVLVGLFVGLVSGGVAIWMKVREFTK